MFTKIECGECGGAYCPDFPGIDNVTGPAFAVCEDCGHEMAKRDFIMDEGETLTYDHCGVLGYVTA